MATTTDVFRTRFPEFSEKEEYPTLRIQLFLDDAITLYIGTDELRWSGRYDIAHAYLAAHLLMTATATELGDSNAKLGPLSSKSAGGVSVTRAIVAKDSADADLFLKSSTYGLQYLIVRNSTFAGILVV